MIGSIHCFKIIESTHLSSVLHMEVKRTWKERLFTFPFKPFQAFKTVSKTVPSNEIVIDEKNRTIIIHPSMKDKLLDALNKRNQQQERA